MPSAAGEPSLSVVLHQPEIPPNTGNIARTCAATGTRLLLIEPLGFSLDDKQVRRAGLDYWDQVEVATLPDWPALLALAGSRQLVFATTHATTRYDELVYEPGALLVFGSETRGLPDQLRAAHAATCVRIPMRLPTRGSASSGRSAGAGSPGVRSLNLANAVAIVLYEALRQLRPVGIG